MPVNKKLLFPGFVFVLFVFRIAYGLVTEFWEPDEFYTYMLGLKFYCTGNWPYFGPNVVYNSYQIPGGLQALLVGLPLFVFPFPEAPLIFLNLLTFSALCFLSWYIEKRVPGLPRWLIWGLVLTLPWSVQFGTRMINPSYLLVFSILFFISFFELMPVYSNKLISPRLACFLLGFAPACSMQIHLSWVLMIPFILAVFLVFLRRHTLRLHHAALFFSGLLAGLLTLLPTLFVYGLSAYKDAAFYLSFQKEGIWNLVPVFIRFLSFSTYEVPYFSGTPADRLLMIKESPWMIPFTGIVLVFGFLQLAVFIVSFFRKDDREWKQVKRISFFTVILIFIYFMFSQKGPSSHTFYILYPVSLLYSMYCYRKIFKLRRYFRTVFIVVLVSGTFFLAGMGRYKYHNSSMYLNRTVVREAIGTRECGIMVDEARNRWKDRK